MTLPGTATSNGRQVFHNVLPQVGPFTEHGIVEGASTTSLTMPRGAVPISPEDPQDIAVPVEIEGTGIVEIQGEAVALVTSVSGLQKDMVPVELPG